MSAPLAAHASQGCRDPVIVSTLRHQRRRRAADSENIVRYAHSGSFHHAGHGLRDAAAVCAPAEEARDVL
jgi:hypothetical protein